MTHGSRFWRSRLRAAGLPGVASKFSKSASRPSHCAASGDAWRDGKAWCDRLRVIPERLGGSLHDGGNGETAEPARNEAKNGKV